MSAPPAADLALGLDLGGTNIRAAIVDREGQILARDRRATPYEDGRLAPPERWVEALVTCARPLLVGRAVCGVGLASGGQWDPVSGVLRGIHTGDPAFIDYPLAAELSDRLGLPVWADNDVKMAALGELRLGAGQGYRHLICCAIGTGIGGAIIIDGALFHGATGLAGHIGQVPQFETGMHIEDAAGGVFIGRLAEAAGVIAQIRHGDPRAAAFIKAAGFQLGMVLAGLVHVFEPEAVLLGGTVGTQPEYLVAVNAGMGEALLPNWSHIRALPMALGPDAGLIGATVRAFEACDQAE
jgi:glucokinase